MTESLRLIVLLTFYGLAYGMILYFLAIGLSITLGLMRFVNLAHGVFAMMGGYITATVVSRFGVPFLLSVCIAVIGVAGVGVVLERLLYRRLYAAPVLDQVLFSIALVFISMAAARFFYGPLAQPITLPAWLSGRTNIGVGVFPTYRVFLIALGTALTLVIWITIERSRFGACVRAAVDNRRMAEAVGINVSRIFTACFAIGSGLAALGGSLGADLLPIHPGYPNEYLVYFLIIVAIAGLGNINGAFFTALSFGVGDTMIRYVLPDLGRILLLAAVMIVLFFKPHGFASRTHA